MRLSTAYKVLVAALAPAAASTFVVQPASPARRADVSSSVQTTTATTTTFAPTSSLRMAQPGYYLDTGDVLEGEEKKTKAKTKREKPEKKPKEPKKKPREPKEKKPKPENKPKEKKPKEPKKPPKATSSAAAAVSGKEFNPFGSLIAPLAPLAALGAGRAYLTRRDAIREDIAEIAAREEELKKEKAELESKGSANGVSTILCVFCMRFFAVGC